MVNEATCIGCGATLQTVNQHESGYVPRNAQVNGQNLCRRCFRIRHYGEFIKVNVSPADFQREVSRILDRPGLILYTLDVFDLGGSLIRDLSQYVDGSKVVLVVNKADLLPKEVNIESAKLWVKQMVEMTGVSVEDVLFVSAANGYGVDELMIRIKAFDLSPVYVIGMANVGKSTLLNRVLQTFGKQESFTVSRMPGTTLGLSAVEIPFEDGQTVTFVDTPGLIHGNRVIDKLCPQCLKRVTPQSRLRPRIFQLNGMQTLWIGGLARFDFISGIRQPIVCYVSNELPIHRCKLERAAIIGELHASDILQVPCEDCRKNFNELVPFDIFMSRSQGTFAKRFSLQGFTIGRNGADLVIPGLGFITLFGHQLEGKLWVFDGLEVSIRRRMIGNLNMVNA